MTERLSEKEQKLLRIIRENPYISQQELAEHLFVSRPTVANMISNLIKKGHIVGRAYILADDEPIICIGGANIDRKFHTKDKAKLGTSNPSKSTQSAGGVARNVAENLGRLGLNVSLLTCCGQDSDWSFIDEVTSPFVNLDLVAKVNSAATGSYTAVIDSNGEMIIALADMEVYEYITPEFIQRYEMSLMRSGSIIADLNVPKETIQYLNQFAENHNKSLVLIAVSSPKMKRLPDELNGVTWLITNREESEVFFNKKIESKEDWIELIQKWIALGVKNVAITNGNNGAMIGNKEGILHIPAIQIENIIDVTGAGDAFSSALIYTWLEGESLKQVGKAAAVNAAKTLQSAFTVRPDLSATQLQKDMEEL